MPDSNNRESLSPAVNSAADILNLLAEVGEPMGGAEIARRIDRAKSTSSNILAALEQSGLLERSGNEYQLGRKLVELGGAYLAQTDLVAEFHRLCRELPLAKEETLSLSSLQGEEILYLAHHNGSQPVRWFANVGARLPAVATAMGITMLASIPETDFDEFIASDVTYPCETKFSYRNGDELKVAVEQARTDGYAIGDQLNTLGLCSLARPVRSRFDNRNLAVGVTMLSARRDPELETALLDDLRLLAESLPPATD
jgi:DNA-binding IclR family transcriptional regulator